jgi:hypothetical protein
MAPVAGMPPKNGPIMLPTPCASSSASGSWRVRAMPSATTAERSDSMAPSMATAKAPGRMARRVASENSSGTPPGPGCSQGRRGRGGSCGMPGITWPPTTVLKRVAMVASETPGTSAPMASASRAATGRAMMGPGIRLLKRGQRRSRAKVVAPTTSSQGEKVPRASHMAITRSR